MTRIKEFLFEHRDVKHKIFYIYITYTVDIVVSYLPSIRLEITTF